MITFTRTLSSEANVILVSYEIDYKLMVIYRFKVIYGTFFIIVLADVIFNASKQDESIIYIKLPPI